MPDDVLPARAPDADAMPLRKLLEVTHFHLFSMPVYLMILAHLFMLSRWGTTAKLTWIALATLAVATHLAAPWIARSHVAGARAFYAFSGGLLMVTFLVLALVPLFEMWRRVKA
jgi:fatty-acid desaturase